MIKTILFDFDGVLTLDGHNCPGVAEVLAKKSDYGVANIEVAYHRYNRAIREEPQDFGWISEQLAKKHNMFFSDDQLLAANVAAINRNEPIINLSRQLKAAGYPIGLITDNPSQRLTAVQAKIDLSYFDVLAVSQEHKTLKTQSALLFELALKKLSVKASEAIFIDDIFNRLEHASALGIQTFHYQQDDEDLYSFLKNKGVLW